MGIGCDLIRVTISDPRPSLLAPGVLRPAVRDHRHSVPVCHPAGRGAGQHDGGHHREGHQESPHHHQLLPGQPRPRRPHHPAVLRAPGTDYNCNFCLIFLNWFMVNSPQTLISRIG